MLRGNHAGGPGARSPCASRPTVASPRPPARWHGRCVGSAARASFSVDVVKLWIKSKAGMNPDLVQRLRDHGVQPSAQRLAVADYVLTTVDHPSADQVLEEVHARLPMLSRATVYNTLNLFVEKGLLRPLVLAEGKVVFDPRLEPHHHFVDEETGRIEDIPWGAVRVGDVSRLEGYHVREYMVVLRGRKLGGSRKAGRAATTPRKR